jgi:adenine deaminase
MDRVLRHAIGQGLTPMAAVQMATLNTAEHFGVSRRVGMIAPGRSADILLVDDLNDFHARLVIAAGVVVAENGKMKVDLPEQTYPAWALRSIHLKRPLAADDFRLAVNGKLAQAQKVTVNVIGVIENQAPTRHLQAVVPVKDGEVQLIPGLAKVAHVERHHATGRVQLGLVSGFGFTGRCAIASTVVHDSHHMIVVGTHEADMALAANKLAEVGGGQVVVKDGKVIGLVELKIAGLMSAENARSVAQKATTLLEGFRLCGCAINNPNMQLSLLALVVIPELRISDKGLVDVTAFKFLPVIQGPAD